MEPPLFDRPLISLDQSHNHLPQDFITKKTLTSITFYCKIIGNCTWYAISTSKNNYHLKLISEAFYRSKTSTLLGSEYLLQSTKSKWLDWKSYYVLQPPIHFWFTCEHAYCIKILAPCATLTYLSSEKKTFHCQLCSTCYTAVQINNNFCNQRSHYENYGWFPLGIEAITFLHRSFLWWAKINGGTGKSMKNALYV